MKSVVLVAAILVVPNHDAFSPIRTFRRRRWGSSPVKRKLKNDAVFLKGFGNSVLYGSLPSTETSLILDITGILSPTQFKKRSALHETLNELRQQIPRLLSVPLSEASAEKVYTEKTRLAVGPENLSVELSSDRTELISLCNAFVLALAASLQASSMFSSLIPRQQQSSNSQKEPSVECQIALVIPNSDVHMNQDFNTLEVRWEALIPIQQPMASSNTVLRGVSRLILDPESNKIASHQLLNVYINDSLLESNAVGQSLASLRQTVKGIQGSPLFQPLLSATTSSPVALSALEVFQQARDDFINRQLSQMEAEPKLAPLFVLANSNTSNSTLLASNQTSWVPIDSYSVAQSEITLFPLPGTSLWPVYASCHRLAETFVEKIIPMLSGRDDNTFEDTLFHPNARLYASDGSTLLRTGTLLAGYYKSLAALRLGTGTTWALKNVRVLRWDIKLGSDPTKVMVEIEVEFSTEVSVPGSSSVAVSGMDLYTVSSLLNADIERSRSCIEEVQQKQLSIGDNLKSSETLLLMRSVASAIESSSGRMPFSDGFWFDLLRRLSLNDAKRPIQRTTNRLPIRSDNAAMTVYRIMEALHQDLMFALLSSDLDNGSTKFVLPPGSVFMSENVQLIGYLEEPLLRGRTSYNQAYQVAVQSLRAALKSKSVLSVKEPTVQVELNASGNIVWSLSLFLKVSAPFVFALPGWEGASVNNNSNSLSSINIAVKSEYCLCPETGQILQHRLLESRINGRLTPGDVVSRLIKQSGSETSDEADPLDWLRISLESVEWLRFLSDKPA
jgi:hypothetical protein